MNREMNRENEWEDCEENGWENNDAMKRIESADESDDESIVDESDESIVHVEMVKNEVTN